MINKRNHQITRINHGNNKTELRQSYQQSYLLSPDEEEDDDNINNIPITTTNKLTTINMDHKEISNNNTNKNNNNTNPNPPLKSEMNIQPPIGNKWGKLGQSLDFQHKLTSPEKYNKISSSTPPPPGTFLLDETLARSLHQDTSTNKQMNTNGSIALMTDNADRVINYTNQLESYLEKI